MKRTRSVALAVAAWLTVTVLGSAMTWAVISRAGSEVVSVSPAATATRDTPTPAEPSPSTDERELSQRGGTAVPGPTTSSRPPTPRASQTPTRPSPSAGVSPTRPPPATPSSPTALPSATSPTAQAERHGTWQGPGGIVVVHCRGNRAALGAAQPDSGYQIRVRRRGPDRVEVEFEGQGAHEDATTRVDATCVAGGPRFEADVDRD